MAFVHLHTHTEYSLLDGADRASDLVERASALGQNALAITDHGYMYGAAAFYQACMAHNAKVSKGEIEGIPVKPIIGCEVYFTLDRELKREGGYPELYHMILLAKNDCGYKNLVELCSDAAVRGFYYKPRVTIDMLREHHEGLIATSACVAGILARRVNAGDYQDAKHWAQTFAEIFGYEDFFVELQDQGIRTRDEWGGNYQHDINVALSKLAADVGLKTVGTNDIHYLSREDKQTQDIMLCVGGTKTLDDENRMHAYPETFMKSEEEMREALADFPECIDMTQQVADRCNVTIEFGKIVLPRFPLEEGQTNESRLRDEALKGLKERYGDPLPDEVVERFEHEYKIICDKGFPAYFLIVQEFANWAKREGIGVGPGRGSAAGSIISYALNITTFDPLANGLIFERFLSPERDEMPDIDLDFDDERRGDVIQHCREVYGTDHIANVITFGTMKAKQAINDAARVLGYSMSVGQRISKTLPKLGYTLDEALHGSPSNPVIPDFKDLYDNDPDSRKIIDSAMKIEGLVRGEGVHASAVIICRDAVQEYVPIKYDTKGESGDIITQYDGGLTAALGLLKMDFLGLRTLTVISRAKEYIKRNHGVDIDEDKIPFDDPAIYDLFAIGDTAGVFQVESEGMVALLKRMKPDRYADIVALIALYRPGPIKAGMIEDYCDRKHGVKKVVYYDDRLKSILEPTYGTMVYQEQVMQISMVMSGFSAGESDKLRKAVAKKHIELMREKKELWSDGTEETMEDHWMNGAVRNGYELTCAQRIWSDVLEFASYAFNKSHSAAYAILTMQTAWLKAHYPHEFMAAVLTSFTGKTDQIVHYISCCTHGGIPILPPDINTSRRDFTPTSDGIRFGLAGIRGVGDAVADAIIAERTVAGPFISLHDYIDRVDSRMSNKRVVEALIKGGAFDSTGYPRRQLMGFVENDNLLDRAAHRQRDRESGQISLGDLLDDGAENAFTETIPEPDGVEWPRLVKLSNEKAMLGHYVSDHPLAPFKHILSEHADCSLQEMEHYDDGERHRFAGMIASYAIKPTKRGTQFANFTLEDTEGEVSASMFGKAFEENRQFLSEDAIVSVYGRVERSDRGISLNVWSITPLNLSEDDARIHSLEVRVSSHALNKEKMDSIADILSRYPGRDGVTLFVLQTDGKKFRAELPTKVNSRSGGLITELEAFLGPESCRAVVF